MNNDINKELSEAIVVLAKQISNALNYSKTNYDRTFISIVRAKNNDGTYTIIDEYGDERKCVLCIPNINLNIGQKVFATIPQGNLKHLYISGVFPKIDNR